MSLATHLIHTCTIERITQTTTDPYGASTPTWAVLATDVPCRLVEKSQQMLASEHVETAFVTTYSLLVDAGVDVKEQDRIVVGDRTFTITEMLTRNGRAAVHHKTARLVAAE